MELLQKYTIHRILSNEGRVRLSLARLGFLSRCGAKLPLKRGVPKGMESVLYENANLPLLFLFS